MKKYRMLGAVVVAAGIAATPAAAQDWDSVVAAAKKEGTVTVYHAQFGTPHWRKVIQAFKDKYGIDVKEFDTRASELTERVRVEQTSQHYVADVEFHGEATIGQQRQGNFIAEHGDIPNAANLRPPFVADKWAVPAWVQVICPLVNTTLVKPADEPKVWSDLLDPKWKGRLLSDDMAAIGSGQTTFAAFAKAYGMQFLQKLKEQNLVFDHDLQQASRRVARGEYSVLLQQIIAFASPLKGLPVKVVLPEDGCPYTLIEGAVLNGAPHPNAARLLINHLLDPQSQLTYAEAWMGITTKGVADKLSDPDARRFADVKLLGTATLEDREAMQKAATEMFK